MSRFSLVLLALSPCLSGCLCTFHSLTRKWEDCEQILGREVVSATDGKPVPIRVSASWNGRSVQVLAKEQLPASGHVVQRVRHERHLVCAAEDAFLILVSTLPFSLLEIPLLPIDLLLILPYLLAGHRLSGWGCGYEYDSEPAYEVTEEWDFQAEPRSEPAAGLEIQVRLGANGDEIARLVCDQAGGAMISSRQILSWSRGRSEPPTLMSASRAQVLHQFKPAEMFRQPGEEAPDWSAAESPAQPQLTASSTVRNGVLVVRIENKGPGEAFQAAALLPEESEFARDVLAFGRMKPGESRELAIEVPGNHGHARIEFSQAFGAAPGPIDVEW